MLIKAGWVGWGFKPLLTAVCFCCFYWSVLGSGILNYMIVYNFEYSSGVYVVTCNSFDCIYLYLVFDTFYTEHTGIEETLLYVIGYAPVLY